MSILSMEPRRIPIEELKPGEFYDIQSSDESPIVYGVLLLEQLPNSRAKLMLMCSSDNARFISDDAKFVIGLNALQVVTMPLGTVYPYHAFTHLPDKILKWPKDYEGEELISQIKEEMRRAVSEGCWVFNLPHFCEGYLQVYLSYLRWNVNCPSQEELVDLWFEFLCSFFSVMGDHILRVKLLPTELISELLKSTKFMNQLSERTGELRESILSPLFAEKEKKLAATQKSFIDSYRPIELSAGKFDRLWVLILQEYHQDWVIWQVQEPLSLRSLLLHSTKLIGILSCYPEFVRDVIDLSFPELQSEESIRIKSQIESAVYSFRLAEDFVEQSGLAAEELSRIILEKELVSPILISRCGKLQDFVMTRPELFPAVLAYLRNSSLGKISLHCLLKCVIARIAVKDWTFLSFLIEHRSLECVGIQKQMSTEETCEQMKRVVRVALEYQMSAELLRDLLPCVDYGHLVFPALAERFCLPRCREMMMTYFSLNWLTSDIESIQAKDILSFFKYVTGKIALKDWQFIGFLIEDGLLSPTKWYSFLVTQEMYEIVTELVSVALEHNMSAGLLRDLLPCVDYGHLVFPTFVERFHLPNCREVMSLYFTSEARSFYIEDYRVKETLFAYLRFVTCRIELEDWEFVNFGIRNHFLTCSKYCSFLHTPEMLEHMERLIHVAFEHEMSEPVFIHLLPCEYYGGMVFPALVKRFSLQNCRQLMINYFSPKGWRDNYDFWNHGQFLKCLTAQIAVEDWEFVTFITLNKTLIPAIIYSSSGYPEVFQSVTALVDVALEHNMSAELLRDLLPCVDYGDMVFSALAERFSLPNYREVMITYFKSRYEQGSQTFRSENTILGFLRGLTARIAVEDWEFVTFITLNETLRPKLTNYYLNHQEIYQNVPALVDVALEHNMSAELLRDLLPCVDYGNMVFPALVERFHLPNCSEMMMTYCKPGWIDKFYNYRTEEKLRVFLNCVTISITLEDWKFVKFIIEQKFLELEIPTYIRRSLTMYIAVKKLVDVSIEHHMNGELLRNLLPTKIYDFTVCPAFLEGFGHARSKQLMLSYFGTEQECIEYAIVLKSIFLRPDIEHSDYKNLAQYLMEKKLNVWYALGGGVHLQFMWIRQYSPEFLKRLSSSLAREICSYIV